MAAPIIMANNIWSSRNIYWSDLNVVKLLNSISRLGQKRRRPTQPSQEAAFLSKQVLNHPNGCQDSSGIEEKNMCIPLPATAAAAAAVTGNLLLPRANKVVGMIKTHTTGSVYDWRNWDEQFSGNFADDKCIQFLVTIIQFLHISGGGIKFRSRGARNTTDAAVNGKLSFYVRR